MQKQYCHNDDSILSVVDFTKDLHIHQKEKIEYFHEWVISNINSRYVVLSEYLFNDKEIELNSSTIFTIELFILNNYRFQKKPDEQIEKEKSAIPMLFKDVVEINDFVLTNDTKMLCFDVGVLIGEILIKYDDKLKWEFEKSFHIQNYANLILSKKGYKAGWSPVIIVWNFIYQMIKGEYKEGKLENAIKLLIDSYDVPIKLY